MHKILAKFWRWRSSPLRDTIGEVGIWPGHSLWPMSPIDMQCFFDGSEGLDDSGHRWLTLAGYMADNTFWRQFRQTWQVMLRERYPIAPYVHMYELNDGNDPFERLVGWTDGRVNRLVLDALLLLQDLDKQRFRSFTCSIDLTARERLVAEGREITEEKLYRSSSIRTSRSCTHCDKGG